MINIFASIPEHFSNCQHDSVSMLFMYAFYNLQGNIFDIKWYVVKIRTVQIMNHLPCGRTSCCQCVIIKQNSPFNLKNVYKHEIYGKIPYRQVGTIPMYIHCQTKHYLAHLVNLQNEHNKYMQVLRWGRSGCIYTFQRLCGALFESRMIQNLFKPVAHKHQLVFFTLERIWIIRKG